jgi:hypothetical protein
MDKLEQLLKEVFSKENAAVDRKRQGDCLSEEEMAILIENKCAPEQEEKYSRHILSCDACTDLLKNYILTAKSIEQEGELEAPSWLVAKVKDLVAGESNKGSVLDLVLELRDKLLELIETTGECPGALRPVFVFRDNEKKDLPVEKNDERSSIHVVKALGKFAADVEIDKRVSNTTDLVLRLTDTETKKKADGLRVSLFQKQREIESVILENGKVKFEDIGPESYKVKILDKGIQVGEVNVSIRSKNKK